RSVRSQSSGKYYFEVTATTLVTPGATGIGAVNASETISADLYLGQSNNSIGYFGNGTVLINTVLITTLATYAQGNTVSIAIDRTANLAWFRVNAGGWNNDILANQNPATGVGGI